MAATLSTDLSESVHASTESANITVLAATDVYAPAITVSSDITVHEGTDAAIHAGINSSDTPAHGSTNATILAGIEPTDPAAHGSTDATVCADRATHGNTDATACAGIDPADIATHGSTDATVCAGMDPAEITIDKSTDVTVPTGVDSSDCLAKEEAESEDSQNVSALVAVNNSVTAVTDAIPSRRSSRKKQSTFSSDFEYYTPSGKKKDIQFELMTTLANKHSHDGQKDGGDEEQSDNEESDEYWKKKPIKKNVTEKIQKMKIVEDEAGDKIRSDDGKIRLPMKKKTSKGELMKKISKRKQIEDENDESDDSSDSDEDTVLANLFKGEKRKKVAVSKSVGKKVKVAEKEEESSDEEESTPISKLKAQLKQKRKAEVKTTLSSQASPSFSIGSDKSSGSGHKRKLSSDDGASAHEAPLKIPKSIQIGKLAPALVNLVKQLPVPDRNPVKQSSTTAGVSPKVSKNTTQSNQPSLLTQNFRESKSVVNKGIASSHKSKDDIEEKLLKKQGLSENVKMKLSSLKKDTSKTSAKEITHHKHGKQSQSAGESPHSDKKMKEEIRQVVKVQVIRKPDGTVIKRKILVPEGRIIKEEERQRMLKASHEKSEKKLALEGKQRELVPGHKLKIKTDSNSGKKIDEKLASDGKQKTGIGHTSLADDARLKSKQNMNKLKSEHDKKVDHSSQKVDDLLKRGIIHKKKSHQPFGNRNVVKVSGKDLKVEPVQDAGIKPDQLKKRPNVQKFDEKLDVKRQKSKEHRKSSDSHKYHRDKSRSESQSKSDSVKVARRKSSESRNKNVERRSSTGGSSDAGKKNDEDDEPPALTPFTAIGKPKHRHHKPEQEVPVDLTMMDLFKPDSSLHLDQLRKDETYQDGKLCGQDDLSSQYSQDEYNIDSFVKPQNLMTVHLDHTYSKLSSPSVQNAEDQNVVDVAPDRDDIESISHKQMVIMDVNLPDQILEESDEPVVELSTDDFLGTWPDTKEELQLLVNKREVGSRPSILESLGMELKESGTEFRIVGQVEVGRSPVKTTEESLSITRALDIPHTNEICIKTEKSIDNETNVKKSSTVTRKLSTDKTELSVGKGYDSSDKKPVTKDRKSSTENKKSSSDDKKSSDDKSDSLDKKKHKKNKKIDGAESKQESKEEVEAESGEEHKFEDDENDLDWEPVDTDILYCICRKPHNNRFMICCDKCEDWYHGTCVGVSRARGKEMEDKEEEYICPICSKGEKISSMDLQATLPKPAEQPLVVPRCVGRKCPKTPRQGSVYCSNECIMSHAQEALKAIRDEQIRKKQVEKLPTSDEISKISSLSTTTTKATSSSSVNTVEVVERETGKVLTGSSAPTQKSLHSWLEQHPTFEVIRPHKHRSKSSSSKDKHSRSDKDRKSSSDKDRQTSDKKTDRGDVDKVQHDSSSKDSGRKYDLEKQHSSSSQKPENSSSSSKNEDRRDDGPNQIRINVRTALRDCLIARAQEADDVMLSSNEIKNLAVTIEEELFDMFGDTGHKYRTKYRSLVFNIKDQKNKGLFRKILMGKVKPHKLVQMNTEELASRELTKWREQASKHQLEMIEKTEKEALKASEGAKHVRKKTHKGEVEVEDEDLSVLETRLEEKKEPEPEPQEEQVQIPVIDTTDQHRAHLFDLNCKVCTGKLVPGREEQAAVEAAEKLNQVTVTPLGLPEDKAEVSLEQSKEDYEKAEEIVKEARRTMQKMEETVSSLPKIVTSSQSREEVTPPLSPKLITSRHDSLSSASSVPSSSTSSVPSSSARKMVVVRSPDSALQTGLESKPKYTPTGPLLWKGFLCMLDVAKFFTMAYRVSGPTDHITIPDTINILGRISPDQMWDYLAKIRQAGSKDLTVIRFIPGSNEEKVAYVHLYSYLNSRGRCGVATNPSKQVKDFYIVPLASYSKIPRTLVPFDGPGLEENRPHMLIGVLVRQRGKHGTDTADTGSIGSTKPSSQSSTSGGIKQAVPAMKRDPRLAKFVAREASPRVSPTESSSSSSSGAGEAKSKFDEEYEPEYIPMPIKAKSLEENRPHMSIGVPARHRDKHGTETGSIGSSKPHSQSSTSGGIKRTLPAINRDPRLAKFVPREATPRVSQTEGSSSSSSGIGEVKPKFEEVYEPEYIPMPIKVKSSYKPVAEYIPTPTNKKIDVHKTTKVKAQTSPLDDSSDKTEKHHRRDSKHNTKFEEEDVGEDSDPYSPGKEAEPYSPGQEAAADEPYDPADDSLMNDNDDHIISSSVVSSSTASSSVTQSGGIVSQSSGLRNG